MNVKEALMKIAQMPMDCVLVAKPPLSWGAEAMFVEDITDDGQLPQSVIDNGYEYILERDEIDPLLAFLKTKKVSSETVAEFVIHYGLLDSYPSWIDDIPNTDGQARK